MAHTRKQRNRQRRHHLHTFWALLSLGAIAGCPDEPASEHQPPCGGGALTVTDEGLAFSGHCGDSMLRLVPAVQQAGAWQLGTPGEACQAEAASYRCVLADGSLLSASVRDNQAVVHFEAAAETVVEGLGLTGLARVPGALGWLSNGYQSFSQSGVLALTTPPTDEVLRHALTRTGEAEIYRKGPELAWWSTYVGSDQLTLFTGAVTADRFVSWFQINRLDQDLLRLRLFSGGVGEEVTARPGQQVSSEVFHIELGTDAPEILSRYGNQLQSRVRDKGILPVAGWNSWYALWLEIDPATILEQARLLRDTYAPLIPATRRPFYVVIDSGWSTGHGNWIPNKKFAGQMAQLATTLEEMGLGAGLYMAPLVADDYVPVWQEHPEWFVRGITADNPTRGETHILDVTHPEAAAYLQDVIRQAVSWGYTFLKLDFMYGGALNGERYEDVTGLEAYHRACQLIREAAGEETYLLIAGGPPIASFPYIDGWRPGNDIGVSLIEAAFPFVANQFRSYASRWYYCLASHCDTEPALLRVLPYEEVVTGAWVAAASGQMLFFGDDMTRLPQERRLWGVTSDVIAQGLGGQPLRPLSVYPQELPETLANVADDMMLPDSYHATPPLWQLSDGQRIAINTAHREVTVDDQPVPAHATRLLDNTPK